MHSKFQKIGFIWFHFNQKGLGQDLLQRSWGEHPIQYQLFRCETEGYRDWTHMQL
jgi:hypothetical protein